MGNLGGGEILVILVVALVVLGPTRLPEAARQAGRAIAELKRLSSGFQREMKSAMDEVSIDLDPDATKANPAPTEELRSEAEAAVDEAERRERSRRLVTGSTAPPPDDGTDLGALNGADAGAPDDDPADGLDS